jgi:hypothetical protein
MDTFRYKADDQPFASGNRNGRFHGQGLGGAEDGLESRNLVRAITETGVNEDQVFFIDFEVGLGPTVRKQRLIFQPNTITPFLINLRAAQGEDQELNDTAVAFQGVVTAGPRRSQLIYLVTRILGRYGRKNDTSLQKRLIVVSHTERKDRTRIISARPMDRKERCP